MTVVQTIADARAQRAKFQGLALVPTLGALHAGHASLIRIARQHAPAVAVSIFVNPTQFGPQEDLARYPRPLEADLTLCREAGADLVFNPSADQIYPPGVPELVIDLPQLTGVLEGKHRPGHFRGVCQVVVKLFNIIRPDVACFGQKDFQQLRVIEAMVQAMNLPIRTVACPTIREPDGLAMSSRNQYLSADERQRALSIGRGLMLARDQVRAGISQTNRLITTIRNTILDPGTLGRIPVSIDYVAAVDPVMLKPVDVVSGPTVLAVAARVGGTRLIDNITVGPDGGS
jgi:pantoate--beta-alanine ligase